MKEDLELKQFRDLMPPPDHWDEGFGLKAMVGGLFVGIIMTPASMYMQLVVGSEIGPAAQWVTIILFIEVARRSFTVLIAPEIFVLYYMAGAAWRRRGRARGCSGSSSSCRANHSGNSGWPTKFRRGSRPRSPDVLGLRSFLNPAWYAPIGLIGAGADCCAGGQFWPGICAVSSDQ